MRFSGIVRPAHPVVDALAASNPENPFCTWAYATARSATGDVPVALTMEDDTGTPHGCLAFMRWSFLTRTVSIQSLPVVSEPALFWQGVRDFCRRHRVWDLSVDSFASTAAEIPRLGAERTRRDRTEYVLDLRREDPLADADTNHRRNLARARKAALAIRRTRDPRQCASHFELMNASMRRRAAHGEDVGLAQAMRFTMALLESGSGELVQAIRGDELFSSVLLLRADGGAYYQSAGTTPAGMAVGASPFLIAELAALLRDEGMRVFNLGGAGPESPGLQRFKAGFGARPVPLQAASFIVAPPVTRTLRTAARWVRNGGKRSGAARPDLREAGSGRWNSGEAASQ